MLPASIELSSVLFGSSFSVSLAFTSAFLEASFCTGLGGGGSGGGG